MKIFMIIKLPMRKNLSVETIKNTGKCIVIILPIILITCCEVASMKSNTDDLFKLIGSLSEQRPFNTKKIEEITGLALQPIKNESNEYFTKYRSEGKSEKHDFELSLEMRFPTSKSSHSDGLLILHINSELCIKQDEIIKRFGLGEPRPPSPNMHPEKALLYIAYRYEWGKISFGIKYHDPKCLEKIVLNAIEEK
jgi:hypothetical protein